jgi:hypothetical protein
MALNAPDSAGAAAARDVCQMKLNPDGPGPQGVGLGEVGAHRRGVQHQQPGGLVTVIAEGVRGAARHQQEVVPAAALLYSV